MICNARGPNHYVCTLPRDHIESETHATHVATMEAYDNDACDCISCVGEFLAGHPYLDEWEDYQSVGNGTPIKYTNPPDLRTKKAERLP